MALTRVRKSENVQKLAAELESSTSAIVGSFTGLTASKDFDLRKAIRGAGGSYHVVKNKLAARASKGTRVEAALQGLKGVSSVAYTSGDPVALAKALSNWVKDNAEFTFKLGIIDGKVISVEEIGALATLPGKEELFSKLLFLINSPAQRLATVLNATGRDLAVVLNQGVEKGKFAAAEETSPATPSAETQSVEAPSVETQSVEAPSAAAPATSSAEAPSPAPASPAAASPEAASTVPAPVAETTATEAKSESSDTSTNPEAAAATEASPNDGQLVAETHAIEAPTPEEQIAEHPASEADPVAEPAPEEPAQPENGTASQAGEAATRDPAEG